MARHFRTGLDAMVREVELEELEKKWAEQNRRIMNEHPPEVSADPQMEPLPEPAPDSPPPFVAQSAPSAPAPASDGPPYIAADADAKKGDAAA